MLQGAAQLCYEAHREGLLTVLWVYPRGKAVPNERDPHLIAGCAGLAATLGADFCKVNYPKVSEGSVAEAFREAAEVAAGTADAVDREECGAAPRLSHADAAPVEGARRRPHHAARVPAVRDAVNSR